MGEKYPYFHRESVVHAHARRVPAARRSARHRAASYDLGMTLQQDIFLVPEQFPTLQAAIDAAVGPASIIVQPGLYKESLRLLNKESIVIQSARLSRRGVTLAGSGGLAVVDVRHSQLHASGISIRSDRGLRGIFAEDAHVNLQECLVAGNRSDSSGAGMLCRRSRVHLQKSAILANVLRCDGDVAACGGGLYLEACDVEIAGSTIQANVIYAARRAFGGGAYFSDVKLRMWRSRVTDNLLVADDCAGGGVYLAQPRQSVFGGSVLTGNDAGNGKGGGIFVAGDRQHVSIHRNSFARQNHPNDVEFARAP